MFDKLWVWWNLLRVKTLNKTIGHFKKVMEDDGSNYASDVRLRAGVMVTRLMGRRDQIIRKLEGR